MPVVTINGQVGSGGYEVGAPLADLLHIDYVDRLILAEASKRMGATVAALVEREQRSQTLGERLAHLTRTALDRSAIAWVEADSLYGASVHTLPPLDQHRASQETITRAQQVDEKQFLASISEVVGELAEGGNVLIVGRASNLVLKDFQGAFHIGLVADMESRIQTITARERMDRAEAQQYINRQEEARAAYARKFFQTEADDPGTYHLVINTSRLDSAAAAEMAAGAILHTERKRNTSSSQGTSQ